MTREAVRVVPTPAQKQARHAYLHEKVGEHLERILGGELVRLERRSTLPRWSIHACFLDKECRSMIGWVPRVHAGVPGWSLDLALGPSGRFAPSFAAAGQSWPRRVLSTWIRVDPKVTCDNVTEVEFDAELLAGFVTCWRRRGHKGQCRAREVHASAPRVLR